LRLKFRIVTFVKIGNSVLEIDQGRDVLDAVLFGLLCVVDFDKSDAVLVAFIVDVFQFLENRLRFFIVGIVFMKNIDSARMNGMK
jgi:hypothetical protein